MRVIQLGCGSSSGEPSSSLVGKPGIPAFVAAFLALRRLAPTRLVQAGACVGALSGAAGAAIYAFHCPETALPFMAIWYVAAIAVAAGAGAVLGPRLLRW
ncbi:MAG: NrsF family protein [Acidobacteriota bacterium]